MRGCSCRAKPLLLSGASSSSSSSTAFGGSTSSSTTASTCSSNLHSSLTTGITGGSCSSSSSSSCQAQPASRMFLPGGRNSALFAAQRGRELSSTYRRLASLSFDSPAAFPENRSRRTEVLRRNFGTPATAWDRRSGLSGLSSLRIPRELPRNEALFARHQSGFGFGAGVQEGSTLREQTFRSEEVNSFTGFKDSTRASSPFAAPPRNSAPIQEAFGEEPAKQTESFLDMDFGTGNQAQGFRHDEVAFESDPFASPFASSEGLFSSSSLPLPPEDPETDAERLSHELRKLTGNQRYMTRLHAELLQLEADLEEAQEAILKAHETLKNEELFTTPTQFSEWTREYLGEMGSGRASQKALRALESLDTHLLSGRGLLVEDLTPSIIERWGKNPKLLTDSDGVDSVKEELYGHSRFPIQTDELRKSIGELPEISTRRRQFVVERETQRAAVKEYLAQQEKLEKDGLGASSKQRVWMKWVQTMSEKIDALRRGDWKPKGAGATWARTLRDDITLESELLAVITCSTVLNVLLAPSWRRKDDMLKASGKTEVKQVPYTTCVVAVGDAVSLENSWRTLGRGSSKQASPKALAALRYMAQKSSNEQQRDTSVPLGGALVDFLLEAAVVQVQPAALKESERLSYELDMEKRLGPDWRTDERIVGLQAVPVAALRHGLVREGKKTRGYIQLPDYVQPTLDVGKEDLATFISAKHQPMLLPSQPWMPSAVGKPEGGYLLANYPFIRTTNTALTYMRLYSPNFVASVMDACGKLPWHVNRPVLKVMEEVKRRDMAIAGIPPKEDPEIPPLPELVPGEESGYTEEELKTMRIRHRNAKQRVRELQSERPTFELKLKVARDFLHQPRLYFPHNVDFRGRAYPIPPHLNHMGDDVCRGLLKFSEKKPLGEDGFYWLKVNLANLLGKNKIPFDDRVAIVDEAKETIMKIAENPLDPEVVDFWADADDGPWQALSNCLEIAEVWKCDDPTKYLSDVPVHLDGSCNGLQHYAALGRDEEGARAVNVLPSERPQDVYTIVLKVVQGKVEKQAAKATGIMPTAEDIPEEEEEEDEAEDGKKKKKKKKPQKPRIPVAEMSRRLIELNVLQRKVVKQTVMTICYGVTSLGAKEQVRGQLQDMVGDTVEADEINQLAGHLSKLVLKSIDEVFDRAMQIKRWFDKVSAVLNRLECPTSWIAPSGLACVQPYKKARKVSVLTRRQKVTLNDSDGPKVDKAKQRMGFPPNFVHSMDATHMMLVANACNEQGISFAGVHDSFWTHAGQATRLTPIIRDCFVQLHGQPILDELYQDLKIQLSATGEELEPPPEQGDLDINRVRESPYFFH